MTQRRPHGFTRRSFLGGLGAAAAGLTFLPRGAFSAEESRLNFYNWDTYIGETTLDDFKKASGIEVKMDLFADNDELFAKLKEGNPGYDVIVPTNDYMERMIVADILMPLDHSVIPNKANIDMQFQDALFDPGRKYGMPYMWGTMGIGYRKSAVDGVPDSWRWLFESDQYANRIALLSESTTVMEVVLKYMGHPLNETNPDLVKQAGELLIKQKPHIKVFAEDNGQDLLLSGEVDLTMEWNGDILQVMEEDDDIAYIVPKEGSLVWQDILCIPKGAPHPENAHKFINFILDADVGAAIADFIQYATPNAAAKAKLSEDYQNNPAIFPVADVIAKLEAAIYKGEDYQRLVDETWTRIQAA